MSNEKHARLSPSNLRWPKCPGSIREESVYPDIAGDAAIDGTGSHLLLELCITEGNSPEFYLGSIIGANHHDKPDGWTVGEERVERVVMALNYVDRRVKELSDQFPHGKVTVEAESKSDPGARYERDDWKGTCDITISVVHVNNPQLLLYLETIDYKDGRGWVNVKDNTQLISYLGGKLNELDVGRLSPQSDIPTRISIVQPKTNPPVRYDESNSGAMYEALDALNEAAKLTDTEDAPLVAGKHCQWCKHKPNCTAAAEAAREVMMKTASDVIATDNSNVSLFELMNDVIKDIKTITDEQLSELADARAGIESIFDTVDKELYARIEAGNEIDGYDIKPGRSSRAWSLSDEEMADVLKARRLKQADIFPPKLISPAQAMKLKALSDSQKERLEKEYIVEKAGALKLTKVGKRVEKTAESLFDDVSKDNVVQSSTNDIPSFW